MKIVSHHLQKLVTLLEDGQYHDGDTLGHELGLTRSAVWKLVQKLISYGIHIHSIKGKGYALCEPLILLDKKYIQENLHKKNIHLEIYELVDSTNDVLKDDLAHSSSPNEIRICLAEQQTHGKGRFKRKWHSPFAQNIYFSCRYSFKKDLSELMGLSLVISLAVIKTLQFYISSNLLLVKWPNDIVYDHKKIAGNLIEVQAEANNTSDTIIGIGINVNMQLKNAAVITQPWVSLKQITGVYINRNELTIKLIQHLISYLKKFEKFGLSAFLAEWNRVDSLIEKNVALKYGQQQIVIAFSSSRAFYEY